MPDFSQVSGAETRELTLDLMQQALRATDLGLAMQPVLEALVTHTAAVGAGYFQFRDQTLSYHARAAAGEMPQGEAMQAILAHGLPADLPLLGALSRDQRPLFFADTREQPDALGFPDLGVHALTAAPVLDSEGNLVGALLTHTFAPHDWEAGERHLVETVTGLLALVAARLHAEERENAAYEGALRALGLSLEARDAETQGHTDRVTVMAVQLGERLGLGDHDLRNLRWGAYLHDLGKISLPDSILLHDGPLTPEMRDRMQVHVQEGVRLARQLPFLPQSVLDVIAGHHERWDGAGYPAGLREDRIPRAARIFAVCDVFDALMHARPYKKAWPLERTLEYMRSAASTHFDPEVVQALLDLLTEQGQLDAAVLQQAQ